MPSLDLPRTRWILKYWHESNWGPTWMVIGLGHKTYQERPSPRFVHTEEKATGRSCCCLQLLSGRLWEDRAKIFSRVNWEEMRHNNWNMEIPPWHRKNTFFFFFYHKLGQLLEHMPREVMESPSLRFPKLDWTQLWATCPVILFMRLSGENLSCNCAFNYPFHNEVEQRWSFKVSTSLKTIKTTTDMKHVKREIASNCKREILKQKCLRIIQPNISKEECQISNQTITNPSKTAFLGDNPPRKIAKV